MATVVQTVQQKKRFLDAFAECGNVSAACRTANIRRANVYEWQEHDEAFALAYREAEVRAIDALEEEARRRAAIGTEKPVFHKGEVCGTIREYSDTLLIFLLKGARPEKYRERLDLNVAQVVKAYAGFDPSEV